MTSLPDNLRRFFVGKSVLYDPDLEGQRVANNIVYLGPRAGPGTCMTNLLHEMSHFVEIDEPRMAVHGWGLRYGTLRSLLRSVWYEFKTSEPVQRELRVSAFQFNLGKSLSVYSSPEAFAADAAHTFRFLPTDCLYMWAEECGIADPEDACRQGILNLLDEPVFSYENFKNTWFHRNRILDQAEKRA